jgi:hypothetical protein
MVSFEYKGYWYLPNKPRRKLPGTLTFSPDVGARLDLMGAFQRGSEAKSDFLEPPMILGVSTDGKEIALYECVEIETPVYTFGNSTGNSIFRAGHVLVGKLLKKIEDLRLEGLIIEYAHLDEWVNRQGFDIDIAKDFKGATVQYTLPDKIDAVSLDGYRVSIGFRCKWPTRSRVQKEATLRQTIYIGIEPTRKMSFQEFFAIEFRLATFFGLAVMRAVGPLSITGWTKQKEIVEIFYQPISAPTDSTMLIPTDMLFSLSETSGRFAAFRRSVPYQLAFDSESRRIVQGLKAE